MIRGLLVVNAFLHTTKFTEINMWLVRAAKDKGIDLIIKTNAELLCVLGDYESEQLNIEDSKIDFVIFWDKDIRLARILEARKIPVFNSSKAIEICDDKSLTHIVLQEARIPMPKTIISPKTFDNIGFTNYDFLEEVANRLGFPLILKECFGSFGQQVYFIHHKQELELQMKSIGAKPVIFQEYIKTSFAKDIRINVVGNQVIASMYRYSDNGDFRANITNGGKMKPYEPNDAECQLAISCCKAIGLDFAGVDLLFGENDTPLVCEVNSNAHFKNIYDCTKINVADAIIEYILHAI